MLPSDLRYKLNFFCWEGRVAQLLLFLLPDPAAPGLIPCFPKNLQKQQISIFANVNQQRWLEESGQWLENVDGTHTVLARGNLVLQNNLLLTSIVRFASTGPRDK